MTFWTPQTRNHAIAALVTAYGLSIVFWKVFGVFSPLGFLFVSAAAALVGFLIGWMSRSKILVTVVATAVVRIALYLYFTLT